MQNKEYFEVLDSFGNKTGRLKLRSEVHRDGDWHRAVHIWIMNSNNQLLIQQRSAIKDINPGRWTSSCGGHVDPGEGSIGAAVRELKEELGIDVDPESLEYLGTIKRYHSAHNDFNDQELIDLFLVVGDYQIRDFDQEEEEVHKLAFYDYNKLKEEVEKESSFLAISGIEFAMLFRAVEKIKTSEITPVCQVVNKKG